MMVHRADIVMALQQGSYYYVSTIERTTTTPSKMGAESTA